MVERRLREELVNFFADYASCLDSGRFSEWPDFFTGDAWYRVTPRENHDKGLPLSTIALQGQPMMRDRIYGVENTIVFAPYSQRHIIGPTRIVTRDGSLLETETNYLVVRTKRDMPADIMNVGVYLDRILVSEEGLRFAEKTCVFDNELIPNSLIYPI